MAPWVGSAMEGKLLPGSQDANQPAAVTTGVKANATQAADLWRAKEGAKYFIPREGSNIPEGRYRLLLRLVLDQVADVSDAVTRQLKTLPEFAVKDFLPPVPVGVAPVTMPAEVHFATFLAAFMVTLEYGMEGAQAVCTNRVRALRTELEEQQRMVEIYLRRHSSTLLEHSTKVSELLLTVMNSVPKDGMTAFATQGSVLHWKHPFAAPAYGTGLPMIMMSFMRLRELGEEGAGTSLVERMAF